MLNWLKKIFEKEKAQPKTLAIAQAQQWLSEKQRENENSLRALKSELSAQQKKNRENILSGVEELKKTELRNPNIPERAVQLMEGNREEYCKQMLFFAENLPEPDTYQDLSDFFIKTEHLMQELSRKTARPFAVMQEFFANESKQVHLSAAEAAKSITAFRSEVEKLNTEKIRQAQETAQLLTARKSQRIGLQTAITQAEEQLKEMRSTILGLHKEKAKFESDPQRLTLLEQIEEAQNRVKAQEEKIRDLFSTLGPALKRFLRIATRHKKTIEQYIDDSVKAISNDLHLNIVEVFRDLQRVIEFNRIDLKDKLTAKVEAILAKSDKREIGMLQRELGVRMKSLRELEDKLNKLNATQLLERAKKLIAENSSQEKEISRGIEKLHKDLSKLDTDEIKQKLSEQMREISDNSVKLA